MSFNTVPPAKMGTSSQCGWIAASTFPACGLPERLRSMVTSTSYDRPPVPDDTGSFGIEGSS